MPDEVPRPLSVVRTANDLFTAAATRVGAAIVATVSEDSIPADDAMVSVEAISDAVRARINDLELGPAPAGLLSDRYFDAYLTAVEEDVLRQATDAERAVCAVRVLRAVRAVRGGKAVGDEVDGFGDLKARLRSPDAFELLLEVAHDFRSPLTSILFLAETLRDGNSGDVSPLQRSQLGLVYSAAFGLASVASDIMDMARREGDLIADVPQPYRLAEVFTSVRRLVNPIVEEKGLELRVNAPDPVRAHGHPHALSRVLLNLTTNALKFTDEGWVEIGVRPLPKARLEFYVQDTGRGIPEDRRGELFQPFKRRLGHSQGGHFFSGSGVGLSIARRLVRAMDSELVLESSDQHGTRFSFAVLSVPAKP